MWRWRIVAEMVAAVMATATATRVVRTMRTAMKGHVNDGDDGDARRQQGEGGCGEGGPRPRCAPRGSECGAAAKATTPSL